MAQVQNITLRAEGFSCPSCVSKIETKLNSLNGVERAEVKFSSGRILVGYEPDRISVKELVNAVAEVGYTAKPATI
ncbi:heavy-metal-associated domain-containing protein [Rothia aerolata]|nr:heavy-metal-associated domain-containing protein [Rothia aerolata]